VQQSHKDQPSLDQVEVVNTSYEDRRESSLNISLEEVLVTDVVNKTAVIGDEMDRVSEY